MKRGIVFLLCLVYCFALSAQEKMYIHKSDQMTLGALISKTDSVCFNGDGSMVYFRIGGNLFQYSVSVIDSILFGDNSNTVDIIYTGAKVSVVNPLAFEGVSVVVSDANVTVTSTNKSQKVNYRLTGTTLDGMFKIYSDYKFDIEMKSVNITNADGPAINIQSTKKCTVTLDAGTTNSLADGTTYTTGTEDQKGTLFSEGQVEFNGTGSLTVKSTSYHAVCSDDYIDIENGTITVSGAGKDGIHSKKYFKMAGGTLNITAISDGIECEGGYILISGGNITTINSANDVNGIVCDSILTVSGGTINVTVAGDQSKGIRSGNKMTLSGGTITVNTSGAVVLSSSGSGYNPSYAVGIKCDSTITVSGSDIIIGCTGNGGKGISSDRNIRFTSGNLNITTTGAGATYKNSAGTADSYASSCIQANGNITITGGNVTTSSSGIAGKGINADGSLTFGGSGSSPTINITTTGTRLLVSGSGAAAVYSDPKAIKSNGDLTVNDGTITVSTSQPGADGFDGGKTLTINGGTIDVTIRGNLTKGLKSTGTMMLNGGTLTLKMSGGVVLEASGSGNNPAYCTGIKGDGDIVVSGSSITISSTGAAGKGISSDKNISITTGTINITASGNGATYKNSAATTDSYNATCLTADGNISIPGGFVTTSSSGTGGKGISLNGTLTIGDSGNSPTISITTSGTKFVESGSGQNAEYNEPKAVKCDGAVVINNGLVNITSNDDGIKSKTSVTMNNGDVKITNSYEGIEAPVITVNNGNVNVMATNDGINATKGTVSGGTEQNDGSNFYMYGGYLTSYCSNGDAVDCNGNFSMTGGTMVLHGPQSQPEQAIDVNGTFNVSGGFFIAGSPSSNMNKAFTSTSQYGVYASTSTGISPSSIFRIQDAGGNNLVTFKPTKTANVFPFSSPNLKSGTTYYIYSGGTCTGTLKDGLYTGGNYSGGTLKKSFTISARVTSVTF